MSKNDPRKALGKGLQSLLPSRPVSPPAATPPPAAPVPKADGAVLKIPIDHIQPNPNQPRRVFDPGALMELAQSIERDGIIQPIVVRQMAPDRYQIIAGERRWRASKSAGLTEVPVIVRTADDQSALELAIVENIQREDLNPIELAMAFHRMAAELDLSHEEIGVKTGKDRATVTNTIRLLQLPDLVQALVATNELSAGHARAILRIDGEVTQREVAKRCIDEGWSVRQIEEYTRKPDAAPKKAKKEPPPLDPNVKAAIADMETKLGTKVRIVEKGKSKGLIEIEYYSADDLDRIYAIIAGEPS